MFMVSPPLLGEILASISSRDFGDTIDSTLNDKFSFESVLALLSAGMLAGEMFLVVVVEVPVIICRGLENAEFELIVKVVDVDMT